MGHSINAELDCLYAGEFVSENELPVPTGPASEGRVQETEYVGTFVDYWPGDLALTDFRVLLRDNRVVMVRGHAVQYLPKPSSPSDVASYGILGRIAGQEVLVALFRASEVTGIFAGAMEQARASA